MNIDQMTEARMIDESTTPDDKVHLLVANENSHWPEVAGKEKTKNTYLPCRSPIFLTSTSWPADLGQTSI